MRPFVASTFAVIALALSATALVACGPRAPASPGPGAIPMPEDYRGPIIDPSTIDGDFVDRQHIVASYGGRTQGFDAVVQKRGGDLTLLGLTPFGTRAFALQQRGTSMHFESFVPQQLPFPPRYILIDVHRVYFAWIEEPPAPLAAGDRLGPGDSAGGATDSRSKRDGFGDRRRRAPPDGEHSAVRDGEVETERWEGGRLRRRTFRRADGTPPGVIAIDYEGDGMGPDGVPPPHVTFSNGWYGYRLEITTLSHSPL